MTALRSSSIRTALVALMSVSLAGTVDVGQFLATRTAIFTDAPGRAAGSVLGLLFWLALLLLALRRYWNGDTPINRRVTLALAGLVAVGNVGLTLIHLKAGIGGWRPILGGGLGLAAILLAVASLGRHSGATDDHPGKRAEALAANQPS